MPSPCQGVSVMEVKKGLEGLVVDVTRKSLVDGENGKLVICGYDIAELSAKSTFEETIFLVWNERLPVQSELHFLSGRLNAEMQLSDEMVTLLKSFPTGANPMDVLRTALSAYPVYHAHRPQSQREYLHRPRCRVHSGVPLRSGDFGHRGPEGPAARRCEREGPEGAAGHLGRREPGLSPARGAEGGRQHPPRGG